MMLFTVLYVVFNVGLEDVLVRTVKRLYVHGLQVTICRMK